MRGFLKTYFGALFFTPRFFLGAGIASASFVVAFFVPLLLPIAGYLFFAYLLLLLADYFFLFIICRPPRANRVVPSRLSNGDKNPVEINLRNLNRIGLFLTIVDELPVQLQERMFNLHQFFQAWQQHILRYTVRPTTRGEYIFGDIIVFAKTRAGLIERKFALEATQQVTVFPSFVQMNNYQLMSHAGTTAETGTQRKRKIGQSMEFEQIKDYAGGDDIRTINWKATARRGMLMVNHYVDEKSQQVFCIIDKGRLMKMPFGGLSLLDYSINAVLALSNICLRKQDKVGLITFSNKMSTVLAADRKPVQREHIMQALYKEKTSFQESDFELLYTQVRQKIKQRSLLILFTNFESVSGSNRQMNYLRSIARHHLLLVVFFQNTELDKLSREDAESLEDVYVKTIAEKFVFEKKLVVKELQKYGISCLLTSPQQLTVNSINKYLELKARQAL